MALTKLKRECVDCGGSISARAQICPHCGADFAIFRGPRDRILQLFGWIGGATLLALFWDAARSEERRVGNECRSRWSPYH